jgi:hypothetical protein
VWYRESSRVAILRRLRKGTDPASAPLLLGSPPTARRPCRAAGCGEPEAGAELEQATEKARLRGVDSPSAAASAVSWVGADTFSSEFFFLAIASGAIND